MVLASRQKNRPMEQRRFQKYSHMCGQVISKKKKVNRKFYGETTVFPKYGAGTIRNSNVINTLQSIHISHYMQIYLDYNSK